MQARVMALRSAAKQGNAGAQMFLGASYEQGWTGRKNFKQALKWFRKAATQGNADAENALGQMYEDGEGVKQNYELAAQWYRKAAEHVPDFGGAGQGRNNLGLLYAGSRCPARRDSSSHVVCSRSQ
jgi:TPR repeat protein